MAKLEGVEKALRKAAESIGITQLKDEQKDAIPINAQVIHAEITSDVNTVIKFLWDTEVRPF